MSSNPSHLRGLYALTDPALSADGRLIDAVEAALSGGARLVQYRDKGSDHARRHAEATALGDLCRRHGAVFIINDDVVLARAVDADGVHLGRDDAALGQARRTLGPEAVIGVSCYNQLDRAQALAAGGADYVAFGSFFPSSTKPDAVRADAGLLRQAKQTLSVPVAAIGGINADNAGRLIEAGADMVAVIDAVFGSPDVEVAARAIAQLFEEEQRA